MPSRGRRPRNEAGQASVELVATLPALVAVALLVAQLAVAGWALWSAAGRPAAPAVRAALPGWARSRIDVSTGGGALTVNLRPPSPFAAIADRLEVSSSAWARPPDDG